MSSTWVSRSMIGVLLLGVVACGSDDPGGTGSTASSTDAMTAVPTNPASLAAMLEYVPDTADVRSGIISYGSLARIRSWPRAATAGDDLHRLIEVADFGFSVADPLLLAMGHEDLVGTIGFDQRDVDASISAGEPPAVVSVFVGDINAAAVEAALRAGPGGDALVASRADAVTLLAVGEEGTFDPVQRTAVRPKGESLRLGIGGSALVWARSTTSRDAALAAHAGAAKVITSDETVMVVANELDAAQVATSYLHVDGSRSAGWDVAGIGETFSHGASELIVVLHFPNDAAASAAAGELRTVVETGKSMVSGERWSELLPIRSIEADGSLVVGRFGNSHPGLAGRIVFARDNLLDVG